jgi:aryl-alcohol dehydrogenase-like predicted oxidoreductase
MISGFATHDGTKRFRDRFVKEDAAQHFRRTKGLYLSSVGLGTYLGNLDDATDRISKAAFGIAVQNGVNVIDSAINYRAQRSERMIGLALEEGMKGGVCERDEIFISTKGGFVPFDGCQPEDPADYFTRTFIVPGILNATDLAAGCHAMTPKFLEHQLNQSLTNLNLGAVDLYYVHNPETQLEEVGEPDFYDRLGDAFEMLERKVKEGKMKMYGTATWNGYRVQPAEKGYLSLARVLEAAEKAGGSRHAFKAIQLPYNLAMSEAYVLQNHSELNRKISVIDFAKRNDILVFTSASLMQGRLAHTLPKEARAIFSGCEHDSARSLQFIRSTPGVTSALCGMKDEAHIHQNLSVLRVPPLDPDQFAGVAQSC